MTTTLSVRALKAKCADLVSSVLTMKLACSVEVEAFTPGGERNPGKTVHEWLYFYGCLRAWRGHGGSAPASTQHPLSATDEAALFAMLGGVGERVPLTVPLPSEVEGDEPLTHLTVEPKGITALGEIDRLDRENGALGAHLAVLQQTVSTQADRELVGACSRRLTENTARIVWCLTSEGARPPYDPERAPDAPAPAPFHHLAAIDLTRLLLVHRRVNGSSLNTLRQFIPAGNTTDGGQARWSTFVAATARELGEDPAVLLRDWSLGKIVASAVLAAKARLDAEAAAKATADAAT